MWFPFLCWGYTVSLRSYSAGERRVLGGHLQVCLCRMPFVYTITFRQRGSEVSFRSAFHRYLEGARLLDKQENVNRLNVFERGQNM
jgi:hypothetical protein